MKALFLLVTFLMSFQSFGQVLKEIRFKDNFFNNPVFSIGEEKVSRPTVYQLMKDFPLEQKDFDEGMTQMRIGTTLKLVSFVVPTIGLGYYLGNIDEPNSWKVPLVTSFMGLILAPVGQAFRRKGYNRVNNSIYRYNYQVTNRANPSEVSFSFSPSGPGIILNF